MIGAKIILSGSASIRERWKNPILPNPSEARKCATACAVRTEREAKVRSIGEKCLFSSSKEKRIAVMGEEVAIEKPADAPPVIAYLRHALCFFEPKQLITPSPIAVPICTQGPSVPSGTPERKVSSAEKGRAIMLASQLKLIIPRIAATDVGIPPPLQLCVKESMMLAKNPTRAAPSINRGRNAGALRTSP